MATAQGNDVIMTPNRAFYFDHYQVNPTQCEGQPLAIGGLTTLEEVYAYHCVSPDLSPEQARHIIGAQANVWPCPWRKSCGRRRKPGAGRRSWPERGST